MWWLPITHQVSTAVGLGEARKGTCCYERPTYAAPHDAVSWSGGGLEESREGGDRKGNKEASANNRQETGLFRGRHDPPGLFQAV